MPMLKYSDELTQESDNIVVSFKGKEPFRIRRYVKDIVLKTMEIDSPKFYTHYLGWDQTGGDFKAEWVGKKPWDRWTDIKIMVRTWGQQTIGDPEKNGWMKMKLVGTLNTEYEYTHSIQKSLWWSYNYMFYNNYRSKVLEEGREIYYRMLIEMKKLYGIYQGEQTVAQKL